HSERKTTINVTEFTSRIEYELGDVGFKGAKIDTLLEEIRRSGLFREYEGQIEFRHLLIQEYFAGRGITDTELLVRCVADEWWRRAIVFYFGANPGNEESLTRTIEGCKAAGSSELFSIGV